MLERKFKIKSGEREHAIARAREIRRKRAKEQAKIEERLRSG